jgi:tetratricopeptide (TPR) repeat protein
MKNSSLFIYGLFVFVVFVVIPENSIGMGNSAGTGTVVDEVETVTYGEQLGTVRFPASCTEYAKRHLNRGLALLHNMTYEGSRSEFAKAVKADPNCAMGYWGQAMTYIHPLWSDPPSEKEFAIGLVLVKNAKERGIKSDWEHAYIKAIDAYFSAGRNEKEKTNLAAFSKGWEEVYRLFTDDIEAASLYAVSYLAMVDPADKTFEKQKMAGAIAEKVLNEVSDHPGAHHYIIHAYDYPELAPRALAVARQYGSLAPEVPHALHMPTHIFTRLGYWDESIDMNSRSAAAALKHPVKGQISLHHPHALDYMAYAYLQRGEDKKALQVWDTIMELEGPYQAHVASAYTFAAVPARIALEQQKWGDAASLKARIPEAYPWDKYPAMEAITYYAVALGAAKSGNRQLSNHAIYILKKLEDKTAETSKYWARQVEIQRISAMAWLEYYEGDKGKALDLMRQAASLESTTEKHPVTPGEILPSRELLGDMLLDMGQYKDAMVEYEAALKRSANRFNSLYGAGKAAELAGDKEKATFYYKKLVEITAANSDWNRLLMARTFLAGL